MHQRSLKPHVIVMRIASQDTYEEVWNGASVPMALLYIDTYLTTTNVRAEQLRVLKYLGNNIWQSHKVAAQQPQLALF